MKFVCVTACALVLGWNLSASETNLLSFAYSSDEAALAERPDPFGRALNDGDWEASGAVRFDQDVAVTLDLFVPTYLESVRVHTVTSGAGRTASVSVEGRLDGATWQRLGASTQDAAQVFTAAPLLSRVRYLRVTCLKDAAAAHQDIAEIAVAGRQRVVSVKKSFTYAPSQVANPVHADSPAMPKLTDSAYQSTSGSVQFGPSSTADQTANPGDPAYAVATNVAIMVDFGAAATNLTRVSLYTHYPTNNGNWGTESIAVSNSVDGTSWTLVNIQTNFSLAPGGDQYGIVRRFDVLLPNLTSRYFTVTAQKLSKSSTLRQLLTELEVASSAAQTAYPAGERIPYTYTVDKTTSTSHESPYAPKLTDLCFESNTRHALRFYEQEVTVTADFGYPQYLHSGFAYTWGTPTKYQSTADYYGTQHVDCYGSLDNASWTFLGSLGGRLSKTNTFSELPFVRYVKATFVQFPSIGDTNVSSQIIGELNFYGVPKQTIGALAEALNAIPFAGFETVPPLAAATLVQGGSANGWTFSAADAANYSGYQINGSPVSTNSVAGLKFVAPEGVQTAVMRGTNAFMEAQITVPSAGHYLLRLQASSLAYSTTEVTGYDFRVLVDDAEKGVVHVLTLSASLNQLYVGALAAGAHTLRFAALNSRNCPAGTLLDDVRLFRIPDVSEVPGSTPRSSQSVTFESTDPVALNYAGELYLRDLVVDGQSLQHRIYSPANTPSLFSGFGVIRFTDGTLVLVQ